MCTVANASARLNEFDSHTSPSTRSRLCTFCSCENMSDPAASAGAARAETRLDNLAVHLRSLLASHDPSTPVRLLVFSRSVNTCPLCGLCFIYRHEVPTAAKTPQQTQIEWARRRAFLHRHTMNTTWKLVSYGHGKSFSLTGPQAQAEAAISAQAAGTGTARVLPDDEDLVRSTIIRVAQEVVGEDTKVECAFWITTLREDLLELMLPKVRRAGRPALLQLSQFNSNSPTLEELLQEDAFLVDTKKAREQDDIAADVFIEYDVAGELEHVKKDSEAWRVRLGSQVPTPTWNFPAAGNSSPSRLQLEKHRKLAPTRRIPDSSDEDESEPEKDDSEDEDFNDSAGSYSAGSAIGKRKRRHVQGSRTSGRLAAQTTGRLPQRKRVPAPRCVASLLQGLAERGGRGYPPAFTDTPPPSYSKPPRTLVLIKPAKARPPPITLTSSSPRPPPRAGPSQGRVVVEVDRSYRDAGRSTAETMPTPFAGAFL
jgi:hypothetical protein